MKPLFLSIPHAGEQLPPEAPWLNGLPEEVLMCDVDRYVDRLYEPAIKGLGLPSVIFPWHRYAVDANRLPDDVDVDAVEGAPNPKGSFPLGFHWSRTTTEAPLIKEPMSKETHDRIVERYFNPFHKDVESQYEHFKKQGHGQVYHIDAHSMPSLGTSLHRDPGSKRPQIVVSDRDGKSCEPRFKDLVIEAYKSAGFEVAYNWPYKGGRITEHYGRPAVGQNAIQVEMNRSLYMDEQTKLPKAGDFDLVQNMIFRALAKIVEEL